VQLGDGETERKNEGRKERAGRREMNVGSKKREKVKSIKEGRKQGGSMKIQN
jgi:hypothetical protein